MIQKFGAGTSSRRLSRRSAVGRLAGASAVAVAAAAGLEPAAAQGTATSVRTSDATARKGMLMTNEQLAAERAPLTVVFVHGAFADSSGWTGVIERLQEAGISVTAPPNPLRGVAHDSAYIASQLSQIPGPVVLVGHSYGGMVISNAAASAQNVLGLVYVAAFAPEDGESLGDIEVDSRDSVLNSALLPLQYPTEQGMGTAVEFAVNPANFHEAFAADLPVEQTAILAATQRPAAELAFSEKSGPPAWKTLPSWAVVPTGDKAAGSDVLRTMADRAGASVTEVDGSHAIMISQPQVVTDVILSAIDAVS